MGAVSGKASAATIRLSGSDWKRAAGGLLGAQGDRERELCILFAKAQAQTLTLSLSRVQERGPEVAL